MSKTSEYFGWLPPSEDQEKPADAQHCVASEISFEQLRRAVLEEVIKRQMRHGDQGFESVQTRITNIVEENFNGTIPVDIVEKILWSPKMDKIAFDRLGLATFTIVRTAILRLTGPGKS